MKFMIFSPYLHEKISMAGENWGKKATGGSATSGHRDFPWDMGEKCPHGRAICVRNIYIYTYICIYIYMYIYIYIYMYMYTNEHDNRRSFFVNP